MEGQTGGGEETSKLRLESGLESWQIESREVCFQKEDPNKPRIRSEALTSYHELAFSQGKHRIQRTAYCVSNPALFLAVDWSSGHLQINSFL
jgi:hypothetical protein